MRNSLLSAALLLGLIGALPVSAAVVDQECLFNGAGVYGLVDYVEGQGYIPGVFGQEFVPSISGLVGLDLMLARVNPATGLIEKADLEVYIHEDTIDGAIITQGGLEDVLYSSYGWMHVDFSETAWLDLGRTYVIEVREPVMDTFAWCAGNYEPGAAYLSGVLDPMDDFTFRTYAVPEPVTLSLLSVGALALLRRKK